VRDIKIRDLNQQTSKVLRQVATTGESVVITEHGRKIAMIVPLHGTPYQQLLEAGQIEQGSPDVHPVPRARIDRPSHEVLAELDEDRL